MGRYDIRVAVSGATGRMGRQLMKLLLSKNSYKSIILTAAITRKSSKFIGVDIGQLVGNGESFGIEISESIESVDKDFDILIDFSFSEATLQYLEFCRFHNKNMVIGTTGFKKEELCLIQAASKNIGIVFSPNFSVMINLMFKLLEKTACTVGDVSDVGIIEMHHRNKKDVPSGTSLKMREFIFSGLSISDANKQKEPSIFKKGYFSKLRDINIHAIRASDIVGEHNVFFTNFGERLELTHRAFDRSIFARGALRCSEWLGKKKVGLFDMMDVLELNGF